MFNVVAWGLITRPGEPAPKKKKQKKQEKQSEKNNDHDDNGSEILSSIGSDDFLFFEA